jgi:DNA-binding response OmpR family regulator
LEGLEFLKNLRKKIMPKVLMFFHDPEIGKMYSAPFLKDGFDAKAYSSYKDPYIIDLVIEEKPDILICDIVLPIIDGYDAIKLLKEDSRTKDVPIIIVSNLAHKDDQVEGLRLGAVKYFIMAYNSPEKIVEEIKSFLSNK